MTKTLEGAVACEIEGGESITTYTCRLCVFERYASHVFQIAARGAMVDTSVTKSANLVMVLRERQSVESDPWVALYRC